MINLIGTTYTILFVMCYLPQIIKTYITKKVEDISLTGYWMCFVACLLALVYTYVHVGLDFYIMLNYSCSAMLSAIVIAQYYTYRK